MVDRTAEIATLRQKLAVLAEAEQQNVFIQERGRHNATEADKCYRRPESAHRWRSLRW